MSNPDWNRVGVVPPDHHLSALGDATRWGAQIVQPIRAFDGTTDRGGIFIQDQILSVSCRDQYPRAWTISGTFTAPAFLWTLPDGAAVGEFAIALAVSMGLGQAQMVQTFNIRAIVDADAPYYWFSEFSTPFGSEGFETRPFIMPGAVVGNKINMRQIISYSRGVPSQAFDFTTTLMIVPFSPGVEAPGL